MKTSDFIPIAATEAFVLLVFAFIPISRRQYAFFGVPVPLDFYRGPARAVLSRYRVALAVIYAAAVGLAVTGLTLRVHPAAMVVLILLTVAAAFWRYSAAYRHVLGFSIANHENRVASSLRPRKLGDYSSVPVEFSVAAFTLLPLIMLAAAYPHLPATVPVHWSITGGADGWADKNSLFRPLILAIYLQGWLLLLKHDCILSKMTLPAERTEEYLRGKERALRIGMKVLDWSRLMLAVILAAGAALTCTVIPQWPFARPFINVLLWASSGLVLVGASWLIVRWVVVNRKLDREFGFSMMLRNMEAGHWHGGVFYFNRQDPALFVEKLDGLGYTINFGNPRALVHGALLAGLVLILVWTLQSL